MVITYDLDYQGEVIGCVRMERMGLYYRITCRCSPRITGIYRIIAFSNIAEVDLGVCVPMASAFVLETKVPVKKLGEGSIAFKIMPKDRHIQGCFIPVRTDEPFEQLSKLCHTRFTYRNGQPGVILDACEVQDQSGKDNASPTGQ